MEFGLIGTQWEDADVDTKRDLVKQACKEAYADEFISRLPEVWASPRHSLFDILLTSNQGYSTTVGDAGIKLSGGQRQRLAIARSIVKRPKILILDEATSSIDVRGEQVVQEALEKVSKNRTTLMIAHRLATVKKADNIIVLQKGRLVQQGTHESLMAQENGAYWTLATAQQLVPAAEYTAEETTRFAEAEVAEKKSMATIGTETTFVESVTVESDSDRPQKPRGFWSSFWLLIFEQKSLWKWYLVLLASAVCGGGELPLRHLSIQRFELTRLNPMNSKPAYPSLPLRHRIDFVSVLGRMAPRIGKLLEFDVRYACNLCGYHVLCFGVVIVHNRFCKLDKN